MVCGKLQQYPICLFFYESVEILLKLKNQDTRNKKQGNVLQKAHAESGQQTTLNPRQTLH